MSGREPDRPPERLLQGEYGALLRQANREWASGIDEAAAFRRITARLAAGRRRQAAVRAWRVAAPLAVAALALIVVLSRRERAEVVPELVAEKWRPAAAPSASPGLATTTTASSSSADAPPPSERKKELRAAKPRVDSARALPAPSASGHARPPLEVDPSPVSSSAVTSAPELAPTPDCLSLARQGEARAAESCFVERAEGAGLAAEMALYELSRLRRDVLADADGALRALADYRARFPAGSLRREVDVSQLELLLQLGRTEDALRQSAELLSSSSSGERASELRLLRGHILRKRGRFSEAAREYELAEGAGSRSANATYFRALCLEATGHTSEAAAALTKYLEQPKQPYAEDAKRRLGRLKP